MSKAGEVIAARLEHRYTMLNHPHPPGKYIGASTITSYPIEEISAKFAEWIHRGEWDEGPGDFYGKPMREFTFIGDHLADAAFPPADGWTQKEFVCFVELDVEGDDDQWILNGHPDGAGYFDDDGEPQELPLPDAEGVSVWFSEHKAHNELTPWKAEKALRQAILNIALAWYKRQQSDEDYVIFKPSLWGEDEFHWARGVKPAGIIRGVSSWLSPNDSTYLDITEELLQETLEYYARKAVIAIEHAIEDNPQSAAAAWAKEGGENEFDQRILDLNNNSTVEESVMRLVKAKAAKQEAEAEEKAAKAAAQAALEKCGAWDGLLEVKMDVELDEGCVTLKRISSRSARRADVKQLEADGLDEYIKEGSEYSYLKVS